MTELERQNFREHEQWMRKVLRLAQKGRGRTSPNPMVGAILVKSGEILGESYHAKVGEPHAEINALQQARGRAKGATLYINLEPCVHFGRTPPCAPKIIEAGVARVFIGMKDPNPLVNGKGIELLKKAGLQVQVGILENECQKLNEAFCKYIKKKVPFVTLKAAATLDGKIATRHGDSKWISCESSRHFVHQLRDQVDAVLVGIGTVLKDDPQLTVRIRGGRDPYRIVLDSRLKIPERAKVIGSSPSKTIIVTSKFASRDKIERLQRRRVQILILPAKGDKIHLESCLFKLGELGIMSLLVEGGSEVNGSFLDAGLIDKILFFLSPKLMGDPKAIGIFTGKGASKLEKVFRLKEMRARRIGEDILLEGYFR